MQGSLSYELDLWGKLARIREQAEWQAVASALDQRNTALTLIGATARGYWQIADLNQQVIHQQRMVTIARETLRLVAARHTAGDVGRFELLQGNRTCWRERINCMSWSGSGKTHVTRWRYCLGDRRCCAIANGVHCRLKRWLSRSACRRR